MSRPVFALASRNVQLDLLRVTVAKSNTSGASFGRMVDGSHVFAVSADVHARVLREWSIGAGCR